MALLSYVWMVRKTESIGNDNNASKWDQLCIKMDSTQALNGNALNHEQAVSAQIYFGPLF